MDGNDVYPLNKYSLEISKSWTTVKYNATDECLEYSINSIIDAREEANIISRCYDNIKIESSNSFKNMLNTNGLIVDQDAYPVCDMKYGESNTMKDNGCELIGIYNALTLKSYYQMLSEIGFESEVSYGKVFDTGIVRSHPDYTLAVAISSAIGVDFKSGYMGTNPFAIERYLNAHQLKNEKTSDLALLESWKKPGRVFIFSCWNNKDRITDGLHTFAVKIDNAGKLYTYNGYNDYKSYKSFSEILSDPNRKTRAFITAYYLY